MAKLRKPNIPAILGWVLGFGLIIHSRARKGPELPRSTVSTGQAWVEAFSPLVEFCFGLLVVMLSSWTSKTRREASDDMDEMNGVAVDNPIPKAALTQSMTLQKAKKLP